MTSRRAVAVVFVGFCVLALLPGRVQAQSAIAGVVKDATGGVIPGVTVEAASPVLIEKVRTVVTDGSGLYQIIDLRPGLYAVTFTLPGFNTVKRDGVQLPANFTATVNAEMRVGALEETITVSGEAPVVDMRSATSQQVLSRELLDQVPTGRNIWGTGATLLGVTLSAPDVGGTGGMQQVYMAVHGSLTRDNAIQVDGMTLNSTEGDGAIQQYFNQGAFEESAYSTSALSAEVSGSGVRVNMIPKDGGNTFKGSVFWSHTPGDWQTDNFTDELKATGLRAPNRVERIFDLNLGLGGPVVKDRVWFYGSFRRWGVDQAISDSFYNLDPTRRTYVPDLSRSVIDDNVIKSGLARLTFQMTQKHKFAAYAERIIKWRGHECSAPTAEESCGIRFPKLYFMGQAKYTGTLSSRVLVETGWSENNETFNFYGNQPSIKPTDIAKVNRDTGEAWGAIAQPYHLVVPIRQNIMASLSYVTGSHAFKTGFNWGYGGARHDRYFNGNNDLFQEYRAGRPTSVVVYNTPQTAREVLQNDLGIYVQDSWKFKRVTVNPGIRAELFRTYVPAQGSPAGRFVPFRQFDKVAPYPSWKRMAPRFGIVYDVFGDGKTAVKGHAGKYVIAYSTVGYAQAYNPNEIATDRRTWTDLNGDDIAQDNEIGPTNIPFTISGVNRRLQPDPDMKRPYQWEYSAGIQREINPRLSVTFNWVYRDFRDITYRRNDAITFNDYTVVNIQNPLDASEMIPVYNLNRAKLGLVQYVDDTSVNNRRTYNGFDVGFTSRVGGGNVFGGVSTGRYLQATCDVADPNLLRFCDNREMDIPYLAQFKLTGMYPLPWKVSLSGSWQGYPGVRNGSNLIDPSQSVNYIVDRTVIPNLTQSSVTVPLIKPGTKYLKRRNQIDVRLGRRFQFRSVQVQGQFDVFNLLNSSAILANNQTYGPTLDRPTAILQGRLFAIGAQLNF